MGFYHPATLVTDAARHGILTLPIDVPVSPWDCTLERDAERQRCGVRLGLRYVHGLREAVGRRIAAEAAVRPFRSLADFHARVEPTRPSGPPWPRWGRSPAGRHAAAGAVAGGGAGTLGAAVRSGRRRPASRAETPASPLPEMSDYEEIIAEFRGTSMTTGPHPVALRARGAGAQRGVTPAAVWPAARRRPGAHRRHGGGAPAPGHRQGGRVHHPGGRDRVLQRRCYPDRFQDWRKVILGHPLAGHRGDGPEPRRGHHPDGRPLRTAAAASPLTGDVSRNFH